MKRRHGKDAVEEERVFESDLHHGVLPYLVDLGITTLVEDAVGVGDVMVEELEVSQGQFVRVDFMSTRTGVGRCCGGGGRRRLSIAARLAIRSRVFGSSSFGPCTSPVEANAIAAPGSLLWTLETQ